MAKTKSTSSGTVTVYCNLPSGISFRLPDGRKLTFAGYPAARLVSGDGTALPAGQYGKTRNVPLADWEYIQKTTGKRPISIRIIPCCLPPPRRLKATPRPLTSLPRATAWSRSTPRMPSRPARSRKTKRTANSGRGCG